MNPFSYGRAEDVVDAMRQGANGAGRFLGGGTNLVDLMRQNVEKPSALVDLTGLPAAIEEAQDGGMLIGASVRNGTLAAHPAVRTRYPLLSRALLSGASSQIRNMATVGGNILQRTRCAYFYDPEGARCNKRQPGSGCDAIEGFTRYHAILGGSGQCVATHPSDMCVALAAIGADVQVMGTSGERTIPIVDFHRLPGDRPDLETVMEPGDLITAIRLPPLPAAIHSTYRKVRDRSSYAFALISVAAILDVKDGFIDSIRVAFGGVAPKPWRALRAEAVLRGRAPSEAVFREAADAELVEARTLAGNGFKPDLLRRTLTAVLGELAEKRA
ncbi:MULTISPECIES: FAD binding domain-containing protein [unclassified Sphingobium]|uniref:FAD binding domain-containing protein n=1 Tax=unclassified Sphingobium TaxID=2611147 RepID=UPI000770332F|nr:MULTISPECIES: xanthine dehydrogenase family protein subunit M [unclassified Sphingobium]AMK22362.1 FAD-binding molybdopterin dehydrogenase protein [Sphingobium sp. TKS]NML90088.1 xanthine dehydrogenase family protein subunit M [Sphingobium sp. TB-6]